MSNAVSKRIFSDHDVKRFVSKDHCHNYFDANLPPVVKAQPGDLIHIETHDCFHGKIQADSNIEDGEAASKILSNIPVDQRNPVTGPIFVEGADAGDMLAVELLDIRPNSVGVACCGSGSGQLCHLMKKEAAIRFFDVTECQATGGTFQGTVTMRETKKSSRLGPISFPTSAMLGVIGVAPPHPILTMPAGKHGGNLDNRANGIGSTIYLPVFHKGALLSVGDMHASQGDGEISGCGVEIGGHVLLRCRVLKRADLYPPSMTRHNNLSPVLEYPVTETATHWITHGVVVEHIPQATNAACEEAAKILVSQWGFILEEAFIFLSVQGDLGLCQACHPDVGTQIAKMTVPKLPGVCSKPFRMLLDGKTT